MRGARRETAAGTLQPHSAGVGPGREAHVLWTPAEDAVSASSGGDMDYVSPAGNISQEDFLAIVGSNGSVVGGGAGSATITLNDTLAAAAAAAAASAAAAAASAAAAAAGGGVGGTSPTGIAGEDGPGENLTILHGVYPSGYTLPHIIVASIIVTILMIVIVVGNMLVIIAIATEKTLKNIQNWFIASLAVADFFLGLVIMPFSLANELMGYWIFGNWWCDVHSAMDVLLCTSSIMNLCLISLDRYWSITKAIEYLKSRTPARAAFMIAAVWIMSALVCIPPLLGWKAQRPEGDVELPQCQHDGSKAMRTGAEETALLGTWRGNHIN
uniref:G-protein coupled receptors family 1 profile domain-containing protein n=1 Tax=Anopheles farauti TaxID=69004 RepID=A0A182QU49_9DIPT